MAEDKPVKEVKAAKEVKKYRVIGKEPGASMNGVITCFINGIKYNINENEPVELNDAVLSYLKDARVTIHKETGAEADDAVNIEQGFMINVKKKFEVLEV
jgi:hypothetical protein